MKKLAAVSLLAAMAVPDGADLTIRTRRVFEVRSSPFHVEAVYVKGDRRRREYTTQLADGSTSGGFVTVIQCDLHRRLMLDARARTYVYTPIDDTLGPAVVGTPAAAGSGHDVTVTVDAVDTGGRRPVGALVARHVVTTTTTVPEPGAMTPASTRTQDGWYVDLPRDCEDAGRDGTAIAFLQGGSPADRIHVTHLRTARGGHAIAEIDRTVQAGRTMTTTIDLVEISNGPLDSALFDVPAGYRPALPLPDGGFDLSRPDTLFTRAALLWERVAASVQRLWR